MQPPPVGCQQNSQHTKPRSWFSLGDGPCCTSPLQPAAVRTQDLSHLPTSGCVLMTSHQGRERRAASQWALTQSMHVERNCFVCKKSCHFAEAMGVCVCGRSGFAAATLNARKKIFFVHLISGKYDLHARCLLLCICLPISSRSPFALCTLLGSDHSGAAPTQHTSLPFCISKPRTQPGAAPSPRSPSQVRLPQESSWETSLWAAAVLLLLGRGAGRHCSVPSLCIPSLCPYAPVCPVAAAHTRVPFPVVKANRSHKPSLCGFGSGPFLLLSPLQCWC